MSSDADHGEPKWDGDNTEQTEITFSFFLDPVLIFDPKRERKYFLSFLILFLYLKKREKFICKMFERNLTIVILTGRVHMSTAPCIANAALVICPKIV